MMNAKTYMYRPDLTVKAIQYTGTNSRAVEMFTDYKPGYPLDNEGVLIPTKHGVITAYPKDWIVEVTDEVGTLFEVFSNRFFKKFFTESKPTSM